MVATNTTRSALYMGHDPRDVAAGSVGEAACYLHLPASTVRSWIAGRDYREEGKNRFAPVIRVPEPGTALLSFTNLVEAHVLAATRRHHRVPLPNVRKAIDFLAEKLGIDHPLAHADLVTDGLDLFVADVGRLLNVSRDGQVVIRVALLAYLRRIGRDTAGLAAPLFPFTRPRDTYGPAVVVIDPRISFGRPVLAGTGIPTSVLVERFWAGESLGEHAIDYACEATRIEEAIRCELSQRDAA